VLLSFLFWSDDNNFNEIDSGVYSLSSEKYVAAPPGLLRTFLKFSFVNTRKSAN
jgi:hypothetical protein